MFGRIDITGWNASVYVYDMFQVFFSIHTKCVIHFVNAQTFITLLALLTHCVLRVCQQPTNIFQYYINYNVRFVKRINNTTLIQNNGEFVFPPFLEKRGNKSNNFKYIIVYDVIYFYDNISSKRFSLYVHRFS